MDLAVLVTLGVPTLIAAVAYAIKKVADARAVQAETDKVKAEATKADADTTGRIVVGREADAAAVRGMFEDIRKRLVSAEERVTVAEARCTVAEARVTIAEAAVRECEEKHRIQGELFEVERAALKDAVAVKETQINALWGEVNKLNDAIEGMRP
jgi:hypothetical protein